MGHSEAIHKNIFILEISPTRENLVVELSKMKISCESPQNEPEGTGIIQGDNKYGEQALLMYFMANFYDILKVVFIYEFVLIPIQSL